MASGDESAPQSPLAIDAAAHQLQRALDTSLLQQLMRNFGATSLTAVAAIRVTEPFKATLERGVPQLQQMATDEVAALDAEGPGAPAAFDRFAAEQRASVATLARAEVFARDTFNACQPPRSPQEAAAIADGEGPRFADRVTQGLAVLRPYVRHRRFLRRA